MPTIKYKFDKAVYETGAAIDLEALSADAVIVDLPAGLVWNSNGDHSIIYVVGDDGERSYETQLNEAYRGATEDILLGIDKCRESLCDICNCNE